MILLAKMPPQELSLRLQGIEPKIGNVTRHDFEIPPSSSAVTWAIYIPVGIDRNL
jgi:hypothetical protein